MAKNKKSKGNKSTSVGKPWREFEKLIATFEEMLAPKGVIVKSPDKLPDLTTGTPREVDASIRYKIGTYEILLSIECRKRDGNEDVTWIEQLATKKHNLGLSGTIAVSSSGFSEEAKRKAKTLNIQARKIDKINPAAILEKLILETDIEGFRFSEASFHFGNEPEKEIALKYLNNLVASKNPEEIFYGNFLSSNDFPDRLFSVQDIFYAYYKRAVQEGKVPEINIPINGESKSMKFSANLNNIFMKIKKRKCKVQYLSLMYKAFNKSVSDEPSEIQSYSDAMSGQEHARIIKFGNKLADYGVSDFSYAIPSSGKYEDGIFTAKVHGED